MFVFFFNFCFFSQGWGDGRGRDGGGGQEGLSRGAWHDGEVNSLVTCSFFVLLVKYVIVTFVMVMFAFLSAISELSAWISSTPHLAKVHFHFLIKKKSAIKMMVTK